MVMFRSVINVFWSCDAALIAAWFKGRYITAQLGSKLGTFSSPSGREPEHPVDVRELEAPHIQ